MRCDCEVCRNNEDGYCVCESFIRLDENGVCVDMERDSKKEAHNDENRPPTEVEYFPDSTKMVPLTIEQLRKIVGMPVWVECLTKKYESPPVGWRIIEESITGRIGVWNGESCFAERDYKKDWIAYAAKRIDLPL